LKQTSNQHARTRHVSVQFDAGEQAPPAHLANDRIVDRGEPAQQMRANDRSVLHQPLSINVSSAASPTAAAIGFPPNGCRDRPA
jgi:hypothetical protein